MKINLDKSVSVCHNLIFIQKKLHNIVHNGTIYSYYMYYVGTYTILIIDNKFEYIIVKHS